MRDYIVFAKKPSTDFDIFAADNLTKFSAAQRRAETIPIPGRNGDLTILDGSYDNIPIKYKLYVSKDIKSRILAFRNHLNINTGYQRLEDTFAPDEYRMARFLSLFEVETSDRKNAAFEIEFDCMPQRFLRTGEQVITLTSSSSIHNQNYTTSRPLVRVYGIGTVTIGGLPIQLTANASYTDIDCETESAYRGSTNLNSSIVLQNGKFWELKPGSNSVTLGSGVTRVEITPRYWIL